MDDSNLVRKDNEEKVRDCVCVCVCVTQEERNGGHFPIFYKTDGENHLRGIIFLLLTQ